MVRYWAKRDLVRRAIWPMNHQCGETWGLATSPVFLLTRREAFFDPLPMLMIACQDSASPRLCGVYTKVMDGLVPLKSILGGVDVLYP